MSHVTCIMCGLHVPISSFNSLDYDLDIYLVTKKGRGRGRGWEVVSRDSVLRDENFTPIVKDRLLDVVKLFIREGIIKEEEIKNIIGSRDEIVWGSFTEKDLTNMQFLMNDVKFNEIKTENALLKSECSRLMLENAQLKKEVNEKSMLYKENIKIRDSVELALLYIIKYCDASIDDKNMTDYKLIINKLDPDSFFILKFFKDVLGKKEWLYLMRKVKGLDARTHAVLNVLARSKNSEIMNLYNVQMDHDKLKLFKSLKSF